MATRWGICGAGLISWDFTAHGLKLLDSSEHQVVAVAARDLKRAQDFASELNIPAAYGCYEELAKDENVEVVYIGTIHPEHHRLTLMFLNHGKHVLVEKPAAMNLKQLREMTSLAKEKRLLFMEGVWSRFFPVYRRVLEELAKGTIGEARFLRIEWCGANFYKERMQTNSLGGGAVMDLGVYPLNLAVMIFGKPDSWKMEGTMMGEVDECGCVIFKYNDGRMAQLSYSMRFWGTNEAVIYGTKGHIKVHNPVRCPTEITLPSGKLTFDLPKTSGKMSFQNASGFTYQASHVRQCIIEGSYYFVNPYV